MVPMYASSADGGSCTAWSRRAHVSGTSFTTSASTSASAIPTHPPSTTLTLTLYDAKTPRLCYPERRIFARSLGHTSQRVHSSAAMSSALRDHHRRAAQVQPCVNISVDGLTDSSRSGGSESSLGALLSMIEG